MDNDLEAVRKRLHSFSETRDLRKTHSPRNFALALAGEAGELCAELQWIPDDKVAEHLLDPAAHGRLADEVADVFIYLFQFAEVCGIDLLQATNNKIDRNENRYPVSIHRDE